MNKSEWLDKNCVVWLFLNHGDQFARKIHESPFANHFADFGGNPTDEQEVFDYIKSMYLSKVESPDRKVMVAKTVAVDTENMRGHLEALMKACMNGPGGADDRKGVSAAGVVVSTPDL